MITVALMITQILGQDMVIDEEAFIKASEKLTDLGTKVTALNADVEEMLQLLKCGLNTPAGRKLAGVAEKYLRKPIEEQSEVYKHIAETLADVQKEYQSVFDRYGSLNATLKSYNQ